MIGLLTSLLLAVTMLDSPIVPIDRSVVNRVLIDANQGAAPEQHVISGEKSATITSVKSDFDRTNKVVMFEDDVCVRYASDYVMHARQLFVFFTGSNELTRIVAIGNVAITNETRVGRCQMAKFLRRTSEIQMFGDKYGSQARLTDESGNDIAGSEIQFWLDSEQVEVRNTDIKVRKQEGKKGLL